MHLHQGFGIKTNELKVVIFVSFQWDLVCGHNYLAEMTQVIYQSVMIIGDLLTSFAADRMGRKPIHIFAHALVVVFGCSTAFSESYISFVVLRAITGLAIVVGLVFLKTTCIPPKETLHCKAIGSYQTSYFTSVQVTLSTW